MTVIALALHALILTGLAWWGGASLGPVVIVSLLICQWMEMAVAPHRPDTADTSARAIGGTILLVVGLSLLFPTGGRLFGLALVLAGCALRAFAIRELGQRFLDGLALLPSHQRVRTGPYQWLDHPADVGVLAITAGVVVLTGSVWGASFWMGVLVPLLVWRTREEDRLLATLD